MLRLLALLPLALLPVVVAAPVPRDARPEFGSNGLLARADLEKVAFDTRPAARSSRGERMSFWNRFHFWALNSFKKR